MIGCKNIVNYRITHFPSFKANSQTAYSAAA